VASALSTLEAEVHHKSPVTLGPSLSAGVYFASDILPGEILEIPSIVFTAT